MPAKMSWGVLDDVIAIGRVLLDNRHRAEAVRGVDAFQRWIVGGAIDARPDGENSHDISRLCIQNNEFAVAGGAKEAMIDGVESEAGWPFAGFDLVALDDYLFAGIDDHDFASVFKILVDQSGFGIGLGIFRLSAERDGGQQILSSRIDQHSRLSVVISDVDQTRSRVVNNGIRIV